MGVETQEISSHTDKLFSAILLEQQKINAVKSADSVNKEQSDSLLREYANLRGRDFFYSYLSSGRGHGPFTELMDGSVKYDLIGHMGVGLLGRSHPLYIRATLEAATCDTAMCGNLLVYQESLDLSRILLQQVQKSRLRHFWFAGSGSFAGDTALKIIWQKKNPKYRMIAFAKAFAGRSVAMGEITDNSAYRKGMPNLFAVDHIPYFSHQDPEGSLKRTMDALEKLWKKHGNDYAGLTVELIQGEAGFFHGSREYFCEIFKWAKERNLYIWIDEVQSFGRTRELFCFQMLGLDEFVDIVTVGKSLQCCGTLFTKELNPEPLLIAGTFVGALSSIKAGYKTIRYLTEGNFYGKEGRIHKLEQRFINGLKKLMEIGLPISNIRGVGTMISFQVGKGDKEQTILFVKKLFENGIICYTAGRNPFMVRFLLPLAILDSHIDEIFSLLEQTVDEVY